MCSAFDDALDLNTVTRMEGQFAFTFGSLGDAAQQLAASVASGRWLLHSLAAASWLASRLCAALIAGPSVSTLPDSRQGCANVLCFRTAAAFSV
jgi:hypothetical protein